MKHLKLIPAAQCGLRNDPDPVRDELPVREAFDVIDECANCTANAATVAVLRAEVARTRREAGLAHEFVGAMLRALGAPDVETPMEACALIDALHAKIESLRAERRARLPNAPPQDDLALRTAILEADANGEET